MSSRQIGTIYLGKKGGAESHLLLVRQLLETDIELKVALSRNNERLQDYEKLGVNLLILDLPRDLNEYAEFFLKRSLANQVVSFFSESRFVYFYLPHPLDNVIAKSLLKANIHVIRSIHDYKRHPGDKWPTRLSLVRQIHFSSEIIVHSNFIAGKIGKEVLSTVLALPTPKRRIRRVAETKTVLFVGRFKRYKGINKLLEAWPKVLKSVPGATLILAGNGKIRNFSKAPNVKVIRKWLELHEIEDLIDSSTCVVFPYKEASQSGPLSLAIAAFKPVVVSDVGGLMEQAVNGQYFKIGFSPQSIANGIIAALKIDSPFRTETCENRELADYLYKKSEF